mmetsp:Transcript_112520/g.359364  ORF Transcript_112520/g.359364 Transcript_112520/m.359364 type:complete len:218 (-) Transcript_112520:20-673(-)
MAARSRRSFVALALALGAGLCHLAVQREAGTAAAFQRPPLLQSAPRALRSGVARRASDGPWLAPGTPTLTLEAADEMANAAVREARARKFNDIAVVVMDASGRTIVSKRMISCPSLPQEIAHAKASACIGLRASSRAPKEKYVPDRTAQLLAMTIIGQAAQMPLAAFPGGVLLRDGEGNVVGAVGVSGAAADEDEHCAITAGQSIGLVTEPAASTLK